MSTIPAAPDPVDPPDLPLGQTLRHLFPLWREQWRLVVLGLRAPSSTPGSSLAIPILVQRTIDNAIDGPTTGCSCPTWSRSLALGGVRFGVNFTRRYATARVGVAVEARLRGLLYDALPALPARLLRPACDRRGDLARDERHLPRALLHRLGRGPGAAER